MKKSRARQYFAVDTSKKHQKRQGGYKGHITTLLIIILPAILTPIFVSVCLP